MARCPLCAERSAKRFCPAKETQICAICCGQKREVEIDCPSSCPHLQAGRAYEAEKAPRPLVNAADMARYDHYFLARYGGLIDRAHQAILEERERWPILTDADTLETLKALQTTIKTLASGVYYDSLPDGSPRIALFRRLKTVLDEAMAAAPSAGQRSLTVSEALDLIGFLIFAITVQTGPRPRSRQYLDWLMSHTPRRKEEPGRILLP